MKAKTIDVKACSACGKDHKGMHVIPLNKPEKGQIGFFFCPANSIEVFVSEWKDVRVFVPKFRKGDKIKSKVGSNRIRGFFTCETDSCIDDLDGREIVKLKGVMMPMEVDQFEKVVEPAPAPMPRAGKVGVTIDTSPKISVNELPETPELLVLIEDANAQLMCLEETISHLAKRAEHQDHVAKEVLPPVMPKLKPLVWKLLNDATCPLSGQKFWLSIKGGAIYISLSGDRKLSINPVKGFDSVTAAMQAIEDYRNREILKHFE